MKLFTTEQAIEMINEAKKSCEQDVELMICFNIIVLPTDEEIGKESHNYFIRGQLGFEAAADTERAFLKGVLWMRDKIQGGNK